LLHLHNSSLILEQPNNTTNPYLQLEISADPCQGIQARSKGNAKEFADFKQLEKKQVSLVISPTPILLGGAV
jgi:hypothetical protein